LDQAITGEAQLFDGNAAVASPAASLGGATAILPALVDTMQRVQDAGALFARPHQRGGNGLTLHTYPTSSACVNIAIAWPAPSVSPVLTCSASAMRARLDLAEKLGLAFQLTNIIRDVCEDYKLGRRLSARRNLMRYGVSPEDFGRRRSNARGRELLRFESERAWQLYLEGSALLA